MNVTELCLLIASVVNPNILKLMMQQKLKRRNWTLYIVYVSMIETVCEAHTVG